MLMLSGSGLHVPATIVIPGNAVVYLFQAKINSGPDTEPGSVSGPELMKTVVNYGAGGGGGQNGGFGETAHR